MAQRIIMLVLILIIVIGGGLFAYKELMPPIDQETQGPVYSTKEVTRGDISVGVETTGMLDPSNQGGIRVPGDRTASIQFVIEEFLVKEGETVKQGQLVAKLKTSDLKDKIKNEQEELELKKKEFEEHTGVPFEQMRGTSFSSGITITAPISGRVNDLQVEEGAKLEEGSSTILARIVDDSRYIIKTMLFESEYKMVKEGQKVYLLFDSFSEFKPLEATITKINPNRMPYKTSDPYDSGGQDGNSFANSLAYQVTIEGENTGLIQPRMQMKIGIKDGSGIRYFYNKGTVEKYAKEEKIINTLDNPVVTDVYVENMSMVEEGQPILTLAGTDVQEMLQGLSDSIREKEAEIQNLLLQLDMLEIKAPMEGIVAGFYRELGEVVGPGEWIGSIYTVSDMRMWCEVDDIDVLNVQQGAPVDVTVDALVNQKFEGEVEHVATMGSSESGVPKFSVVIKVKGGPDLKPGMQARAYIKAGEAKDVLLAPVEAIFEEDGKTMVEILNDDGTTRIVPIKLGLMNETMAEVKSGLKEGDKLVTGSSFEVLPSQHIKSNGLLPEKKEDKGDSSGDKTEGNE
ncbi:MAG: efflux RND transporter periplasmic adaptor subunit [Acetivibrionales bacterium]|jgi:HlyD family secretion protein